MVPGEIAPGAKQLVDIVFRSSIDLTIGENSANSDLPPLQRWFRDAADDPLRRASAGNYSWLATIVSDPTKSALSSKVIVSVAVFHKRNLSGGWAGEYIANAVAASGIGDFKFLRIGTKPYRAVRPGEWLMLAGRRSIIDGEPLADVNKDGKWDAGELYTDVNLNGKWDKPLDLDYFAWHRVIAASAGVGTSQFVTLAGADWAPSLAFPVRTAFIFDNIVAVYEKELSLEIEN